MNTFVILLPPCLGLMWAILHFIKEGRELCDKEN
jgi:hypothetical protein